MKSKKTIIITLAVIFHVSLILVAAVNSQMGQVSKTDQPHAVEVAALYPDSKP